MRSAPGPSAEQVFSASARRVLVLHPEDTQGRMLRSPGLRTADRKFYAFATREDIVFKLPAARVAELIEGGAGQPCETKPGRPMREWVRLAGLDADACLDLLLEARAFVAGAG